MTPRCIAIALRVAVENPMPSLEPIACDQPERGEYAGSVDNTRFMQPR